MASVRRGRYVAVFAALAVLTGAEVWTAQAGLGRSALLWLLVGLALLKALLVALSFMHLSHERWGIKLGILIPLGIAALLALVLAAETAWRLSPGGA